YSNANGLCWPSSHITTEAAEKIADQFLSSSFEGGRHARRVGKISC
ncbi:MAG TPA: ribose-5-phosphate isomerase, partial [Cytophagales bacterium]|nr:ribose-5-phosphate isomerase [Cytophagales bacterium]